MIDAKEAKKITCASNAYKANLIKSVEQQIIERAKDGHSLLEYFAPEGQADMIAEHLVLLDYKIAKTNNHLSISW